MIVLDASAVIELLLRTDAGVRVQQRLLQPGETLHAPHLIDLEVAQVMRRYCAAGTLDGGRGEEALRDLADLPLTRYPHDVLMPRIWELRQSITAYDAAYVSLAEALDAPLLTRDARLAGSSGHSAFVELI